VRKKPSFLITQSLEINAREEFGSPASGQ